MIVAPSAARFHTHYGASRQSVPLARGLRRAVRQGVRFNKLGTPILLTIVPLLGVLADIGPGHTQHPAPGPAQLAVPFVIPMELLASRPLIRATVNGQGPFAFLVQPESPTIQIDRKLAETLNLQPPPIASRASQLAVDLGFGSHKMANVSVEIMDMSGMASEFGPAARARGVISLSIWKDSLVTIDYARWRLVVEPGALPEPNGRDVFLLSPSRELFVPLGIGPRSISCRVDPFFPRGLLLPASYVSQLPLAGPPRDAGTVTTKEGTVLVSEASLTTEAVLASVEFRTPMVLFRQTGEVAIVGTQWLNKLAITYDVTNSRARLVRP